MDHAGIMLAADTLWELWAEKGRIPELPVDLQPVDLQEGWAIQRALDARAGRRIGWKLASTSPQGQAAIGVDAPLLGALYECLLRTDGAALPLNPMAVAEAEFAFILRGDLVPGDTPFTRESVLPNVASAHAGIEIPDSRLSSYPRVSAPQLLADFMCVGQYIVGPELDLELSELPDVEIVVFRNGTEEARGRGEDILGDPCDALVWLANELAKHGEMLRDGDVVTTGGCAVVHGVQVNDVITATYRGRETVSVSFTDAEPRTAVQI